MDKPIILEQVLELGEHVVQFSTSPNISNEVLLQFYDDVTHALKILDPAINYESGIDHIQPKHEITGKYRRIDKYLQVRRDPNLKKFDICNVIRHNRIAYVEDPSSLLPDGYKSRINMDRNMFRYIILFEPNLTVTSTNPVYDVTDLLDIIKDFSYVGVSDRYTEQHFNISKIADKFFYMLPKDLGNVDSPGLS